MGVDDAGQSVVCAQALFAFEGLMLKEDGVIAIPLEDSLETVYAAVMAFADLGVADVDDLFGEASEVALVVADFAGDDAPFVVGDVSSSESVDYGDSPGVWSGAAYHDLG